MFSRDPVQLLPSKTVKFLQFNQRKLISQGTRISCDTRPNFIFFEDQNSILWHLSHNGNLSIFDSTPLFTPMHFLDFKFPKLHGLNSHLICPHYHTIDRTILLDLVSHNHQSFQEIASISQVGQGSFLSSLGTLFGITILSMAKGGGALINDSGHGLQHTVEGLGTFTHVSPLVSEIPLELSYSQLAMLSVIPPQGLVHFFYALLEV